MNSQLEYMLRAGRVKRWHTEDVLHLQTVGEHTYGVAYLCLYLTDWTASRSLLVAALIHDAAERRFGDLPAPTKRAMANKLEWDAMEEAFLGELSIVVPFPLTSDEKRVLKLADAFEGALFCLFEARRGNETIATSFRNYLTYIAGMHPAVDQPCSTYDGRAAELYNELLERYNNGFGE